MHGIRWLSCQKSERIPLVAARCVLLESAAESASQGGIFRCSAFVFADKNSIVIIGTLIERTPQISLLLHQHHISGIFQAFPAHSLSFLMFPVPPVQFFLIKIIQSRPEFFLLLFSFLTSLTTFTTTAPTAITINNFLTFFLLIFLPFHFWTL